MRWRAFALINGPLYPPFRADWQAAQIACATAGGKIEDNLLKFVSGQKRDPRALMREFCGDDPTLGVRPIVVRRSRESADADR